MTMRPLPRPVAPVEFYLAAVVDRLDQLTSAVEGLAGRLEPTAQPSTGQEEGVAVRLLEPDQAAARPVRLVEPDRPAPPRHGKGSSRAAWADYAHHLGVDVTLDAGQRDIIAAVDAAQGRAA